MGNLDMQLFVDLVTEVNQKYITSVDLTIEQYRAIIAEELINLLLIQLNQDTPNTKDFSFYNDSNIGYTGYIKIGEQVLFFAPTAAIVMDKASNDEGELSPYGSIR